MLTTSSLGVTFTGGDRPVEAIRSLSFEVGEKEFLSIVGPSGCGKTTLLKCLAGLMVPTRGTAELSGVTIETTPKQMAVVFQDYARSLMPWMTVRDNITLPLKAKGMASDERGIRSEEAVASVGLAGFEAHYPWQLSGGMQQRVAIARAIAYRPQILLMDEPFASVDAQTRTDLEDLLLRVRAEYGITVVFVTHDIDEAIYLSDRVLVLSRPPTVVEDIVAIDLPRPRDQIATKELHEFAVLRSAVFRMIMRPNGSDGESPG